MVPVGKRSGRRCGSRPIGAGSDEPPDGAAIRPAGGPRATVHNDENPDAASWQTPLASKAEVKP